MANYTPDLEPYVTMSPFKAWCQKVVPGVYDGSISTYEMLCKLTEYVNTIIKNMDGQQTDISNLLNAYNQLQEYVNTYFNNLDVQTEIDNKLDEMASDGTLTDIIQSTLGNSKKLRAYNNCLMVTIGDSYALGVAYDSTAGHTVATGQGWPYWLSNLFSYNVKNYASGGAGYITKGTSGELAGRTFLELAEYAVDELGEDAKNVEYVVLSGGINDTMSNFSGIKTAVNECIEYLLSNFKSAKILISSATLRGNSDCATAGDILKGIAIKNICNALGVCYIENSTNIFNGKMQTFDSGDTVHPNTDGYKFMAEKIQSFIEGGYIFDDFMDYVGNANGSMAVGDMCTAVSVNPPRIICERGIYTLKGSVLLSGEYTGAKRIVTGITVPPLNYNIPQPGVATLYDPTDAVFIGTTVYDLVANPDGVHYDIRLQRMYNPEDKLYNIAIPDGTRVYLNPICFNIVF